MVGTPIHFSYGEFFAADIATHREVRIGHEPQGCRVVISGPAGRFPIYPLCNSRVAEDWWYGTYPEARAVATEVVNVGIPNPKEDGI